MSDDSFVAKVNQFLESLSAGDFTGKIKLPGQTDERKKDTVALLEKVRKFMRDSEAKGTEKEEKLRIASLYTRGLIEANLDPLVTISPDGKITDVNKASEEATGVPRAMLTGTDFSSYFTEPQKAAEGYRKVLTEGMVRDYPLTIRHSSGRTMNVLYNAATYKNESGEIQGVFAAARDVTDRKRLEEQLRTISLYTRGLLEANLDPLVTISPDGKITDVNKASEEATGVLRDRLIGTDFSSYFTEPRKAAEGYRKVLTEGMVRDYPLTIRHTSGRTIDVLYNAATYKNEAGELQGVFAAARDVTDRKRLEEQLRIASLYTRGLIEANLDPLVTISPDGKITDVNKASEEATGVPREKLMGTDFSSYFTEPQKAAEGYRKVLAEGMVRDYPLTIKHTSGRTMDVLYNAATYKNESGEIQGVFAAARDVTERKRMIDELETQNWLRSGQTELNDRMRGELDMGTLAKNILSFLCKYLNMQVGAFYVKKDAVFRLFSSYAYSKRKNISNVYEPGEGLVGQAALEKEPILVKNIPSDYVMITSGIGEASPRAILITPFIFEGDVRGVIELGSFYDFTDRQLQFLRVISDNIAVAFDSAEARTAMKEMLMQTQAQAEELQAQAEELQAQQEELRSANDQLQEQTRILSESEQKLKAQQEELQSANEEMEEKTMALEKQTSLLEEQKAEVEVKNLELQKARREIEKKARQLEQTSGYKTEFIANMSHELRTPLNSILILTKMLEDNEEGNIREEQVESLKVIHNSASDLLSLINQILDLSKVEAGKMDIAHETVHLSQLLNTVDKNFRPVAENKKLYLSVSLEEGLPETIRSDRMKIEQVIKNLVSNAIKFTDEGGVTLSIRKPHSGEPMPITGLSPEKTVVVTIKDTGVGIPLEKQKVLFEAFEQAHGESAGKFGGTGLGLYISRKLARLLGGEITITSSEDEGSCFSFYIPELEKISPASAEYREEKIRVGDSSPIIKTYEIPKTVGKIIIPDDRDAVREEDKTVLIIEDDANFAKILFDISHRREFKCIVAGDGETGLMLAEKYRPSSIILDLILPGIDGWVVMEKLKTNADLRHIPIHIISALDEKLQAMRRGAFGYLVKPVSKDQLYKAFDRLEKFISEKIRKLLVIEDDPKTRKQMIELLKGKDIEILEAGTGVEAYEILRHQCFDCVVIDLMLPDMSGFQLLDRIKNEEIAIAPVIVYTGKELTREEEIRLREYTESIIIKDIRSPERLLDEVSLFLHRVEGDLKAEQKKMIKMVHDRETILRGKKILVADDDMRNTYALSKLLRDKEMKVIMAEDGKKALEALNRDPDFDLVLMDIMMPRMDGYEAMRQIRQEGKFSKLPIIALTAKAMKGDREKCIEAGANDYLAKPVDVEKLLSMLRVWLYK